MKIMFGFLLLLISFFLPSRSLGNGLGQYANDLLNNAIWTDGSKGDENAREPIPHEELRQQLAIQ